jgi:protocatechuate 3,4-dioxygenase, beta subunit
MTSDQPLELLRRNKTHGWMSDSSATPRRAVLLGAGRVSSAIACAALLARSGFAQTRLSPTPSQSEGPFYPDETLADADNDLLRNGAINYPRGEPAWVRGVVLDLASQPVSGAVVEIWQCDHTGTYRHSSQGRGKAMDFQGFGRAAVGTDGRFAFRTIKPVAYVGRPPHIHVKVKLGTRELLTTQMYIEGERSNSRDFLVGRLSAPQRAQLEVSFKPGAQGLEAFFPIAVAT